MGLIEVGKNREQHDFITWSFLIQAWQNQLPPYKRNGNYVNTKCTANMPVNLFNLSKVELTKKYLQVKVLKNEVINEILLASTKTINTNAITDFCL